MSAKVIFGSQEFRQLQFYVVDIVTKIALSASVVCVAMVSSVFAQQTANLADPLELAALESRQSIVNGELELTVSHSFARSPTQVTTSKYWVYFDGDKFRVDREIFVARAEKSMLQRQLFTSKWYASFTPTQSHDGRPLAVRIIHRDGAKNEYDEVVKQNVFNPASLGMVAINIEAFPMIGVDRFLARPDRSSTVVRDGVLDGQEVKLVEVQTHVGEVINIWIDPKRRHSILRAEYHAKGGRFVDRIDSQLQRVNGIWFPVKTKYSRSVGGEVTQEQVIELSRVSLNAGPDPAIFTLEALGIPAGRDVFELPGYSEGARRWNGTELAVKGQDTIMSSEPVARWWSEWLLIAIAFAFAAAGFAWYASRKH